MAVMLDWILPIIAGGSGGWAKGQQWLQEMERQDRLDRERREQQQLENRRYDENQRLQRELKGRDLALDMYGATNGVLSERDELAPSWMEGGILPSTNLSEAPRAQAPNRLAPAEIPGVPSLNVPGAQLPRRFREDVQAEKVGNIRAEAAARAEETRAAQDAAWPSRAREIAYGAEARAAATARHRRPLKGDSGGPKDIPPGTRNAADTAQKNALRKLEEEARTTVDEYGKKVVGKDIVMGPEDLEQRKLDILNQYRRAIGLEEVGSIEEAGWRPTSGKPAPPVPVRGALPAPTAAAAAGTPASGPKAQLTSQISMLTAAVKAEQDPAKRSALKHQLAQLVATYDRAGK